MFYHPQFIWSAFFLKIELNFAKGMNSNDLTSVFVGIPSILVDESNLLMKVITDEIFILIFTPIKF